MTAGTIAATFACKSCGNNTVKVPDDPTDDSLAICAGCGTELGRWGDIKAASFEAAKDSVEDSLEDVLRETFKGDKDFTIKRTK